MLTTFELPPIGVVNTELLRFAIDEKGKVAEEDLEKIWQHGSGLLLYKFLAWHSYVKGVQEFLDYYLQGLDPKAYWFEMKWHGRFGPLDEDSKVGTFLEIWFGISKKE